MKLITFVIFLTLSLKTLGSERVEADLKKYDLYVAQLKKNFSLLPKDVSDKDWVKRKLQHMVEVDQYMRHFTNIVHIEKYTNGEVEYFNKAFSHRWKQVDTENTRDLKKLISIYKWFKISEFGKVADNNAWLVVQHADHDMEFQKRVLKSLEGLWPVRETNPQNYAYLFDRVASSFQNPEDRVPQRYGTQGNCVSRGVWKPLPIEDPKNVDARRAKVGLGPLNEYISGFKDICVVAE